MFALIALIKYFEYCKPQLEFLFLVVLFRKVNSFTSLTCELNEDDQNFLNKFFI